MTRLRSRLLVPALALIALAFLFPALAKALPKVETGPPAAERQEPTRGRLSQVWDFLSVLWVETGSILELDGTIPGGSSGAGAASSGDNGSGLDPNG